MTLPVPSATNFKMMFRAFASFDDGEIELALEEAAVTNNGDWVNDANRILAIYYYAAHVLQLGVLRPGGSSGTGEILQSERIGELSMSYAVPPQNVPIDFTMTKYGERYLSLVQRNFPAILTVGSAVRM